VRLRYWWYDLRHRHQTAVEQRTDSFKNLPRIPEFERMQTKPKEHPQSKEQPKVKTFAAWNDRYGKLSA